MGAVRSTRVGGRRPHNKVLARRREMERRKEECNSDSGPPFHFSAATSHNHWWNTSGRARYLGHKVCCGACTQAHKPLCLAPRRTVPLHFCVGQHICECSLSPHTRCGTLKQMLKQIANAAIMNTVDREGNSAYTHHHHRQHHPPTGLHNRNNATRDFDKLSEKTAACLWLVWSDERPKGQALLGPTAAQRRFRSIQHARQHRRNAAPISPGLCS